MLLLYYFYTLSYILFWPILFYKHCQKSKKRYLFRNIDKKVKWRQTRAQSHNHKQKLMVGGTLACSQLFSYRFVIIYMRMNRITLMCHTCLYQTTIIKSMRVVKADIFLQVRWHRKRVILCSVMMATGRYWIPISREKSVISRYSVKDFKFSSTLFSTQRPL